ncbi:MAG: hypothetical protein JWO31_827 [Phycisphaerales bacterium]|nr:hypothetical protein [Phycisphaerales bacterium]
MAKGKGHSPVKAATAAADFKPPTRKSKAAAVKAKRSNLSKATTAVSDMGTTAVEAVKSLAHEGAELVSKVFGGKTAPKATAKGKAKPTAAKKATKGKASGK